MNNSPNQPSRFLTRPDAADYLKSEGYPIEWRTLQKYATVGGGPKYQRFGNKALYRPEDLLEWAQKRLSAPRSNTSQSV